MSRPIALGFFLLLVTGLHAEVLEPAPPPLVVPPASTVPPQSARAQRWEELWVSSGMDGHVSVRDLGANGRRPVAVYLPPGFDPARPATALFYFHGHDGNIGAAFLDGGVLARIKWLSTTETNLVFVCPEAGTKPFHYWMAPPESFAALTHEALGEAARLAGATITVDTRVVSAHSGGGLALRNAVTARTFAAEKIEFLDCNYTDWGMVIADWAAAQPAGHRPPISTWNTPGPTRTHDEEIRKAHPDLVTVHPSPVGHFQIPGKLLGAMLLE